MTAVSVRQRLRRVGVLLGKLRQIEARRAAAHRRRDWWTRVKLEVRSQRTLDDLFQVMGTLMPNGRCEIPAELVNPMICRPGVIEPVPAPAGIERHVCWRR